MPKVTWLPSAQPKPNYLAAVFREYRKIRGMTSDDVAAAVGCTPENARVQMNKPGRSWNVGKLLTYCDALGIPYQEALEAASK